MLVSILVALAVISAAIWLAVVSSKRTESQLRLPMQFGLSGEPTWYAPRRVALAICPVITAAVSLLVIEGGWFVQAITGVVCLSVQAGYLWLLSRWAARVNA